jgi:hypothetical protein
VGAKKAGGFAISGNGCPRRGRTGTRTGRTVVAQKSSKSAGVDAMDAADPKNKFFDIVYVERMTPDASCASSR